MQDLKSLIEKIDWCKNNIEKSSTTKVSEQVLSVFSMSTICPFKSIEKMYDLYCGNNCIKKFCESLRNHAMEIINFFKKWNN